MLNQKDYKKAFDSVDLSRISDNSIYSLSDNSTTTPKGYSSHKIFKAVAAIALAFIGLSCVTVSAYALYNHYNQTNKNAGKTHEYAEGETDKSLYLDITKSDNNIKTTVVNAKADSANMYITVKLTTTDGSALTTASGLNVASLINNRFEEAYLTNGTKKYFINNTIRVDDCKDATSATYELHYMAGSDGTANAINPPLTDFRDSELLLVLKNLTYPLVHNTDIGFNKANLASVITENTSDSGVAFSSAYPDARIIKIEKTQYKNGDSPSAYPAIAITYKVDNTATLQSIVNLKLFNTVTGASTWPVSNLTGENNEIRETVYTTDEDGNITVIYSPKYDNNLHNNLNNYILTGDSVTTTETITGQWEFKIPVTHIEDELLYTPNVSIEVQRSYRFI